MNDKTTTVAELKAIIQEFGLKRGWSDNENAKDLAMALTVEVAELLEIFQWVHSDKAHLIKDDKKEFVHLKEEVADVFWYLIRICEHFNIDLTKAILEKADKNAVKYPAKCK